MKQPRITRGNRRVYARKRDKAAYEIAPHVAKIIDLRVNRGLSWQGICDELEEDLGRKLNKGDAYKLFHAALDRRLPPKEDIEELRFMLLEQARDLLQSVLARAYQGDLEAVDRALAIIGKMAQIGGIQMTGPAPQVSATFDGGASGQAPALMITVNGNVEPGILPSASP